MPAEQTIYRRNKEPPVDEDRTRFSLYFLLFFFCDRATTTAADGTRPDAPMEIEF